MKKYDVVIVGGGPAGSVAARYCKEAGLKTALVEKKGLISAPVRCAEAANHAELREFIEPGPGCVENLIHHGRIVGPGGNSVAVQVDSPSAILDRRRFDLQLLEMAAAQGVDIMLKTYAVSPVLDDGQVTGLRIRRNATTETIRCRLLIAADGVESRIARHAGIETMLAYRDLASCYQYGMTKIRVEKDVNQFFFGKEYLPGGYLWVFPKGHDRANVGIGMYPSAQASLSAKGYLDQFIAKLFPKGRIVHEAAGGVPLALTVSEPFGNGILVCGDAAHMTDPLTGAGIIHAMIAGKLAARTAAAAFSADRFDKEFLKRYKKDWDKAKGGAQARLYKVKKLLDGFTDERLAKILLAASRIDPKKMTKMQLIKTVIKDSPLLIKDFIKFFI